MEQFDQLLTCCVCLDRYRNPKLLPCQHSFCMEPCMEGLVDYVRRQVKCPECRAEHRIPYQGVQAFPTNVTLQRFLELHIDLTGELPDPTANQVMERCQVCSEKAYCNSCAHCEKKVCPDCKEAHIDVLKREITRLSSQVRRVLHKLEDALSVTDKNLGGLKGTQLHVMDEVDDLVRRFTKAIKDKGDALRQELESYVTTEIASLNSYKTNLETEISNIQSNCDVVDKHMVSETATMTWDDQEMMDTKDIFLKTIEFIRNFEYEPGERRIRFSVNQDPNTLCIGLSNFGDLHLPTTSTAHHSSNLMPPPVQQAPMPSGGIMRSKSDHRLVQQYRDMDDMDEKPSRTSKYSKYGDDSSDRSKTGFRSRFTRRLAMDDDDSRVRFNDGDDEPSSSSRAKKAERARVIETDEAVKGPLSGVGRLLDSTRVLEKMVESETGKKKPAAANANPVVPLDVQQKMQQMQQQQLLQQQHVQQGTTSTASTAGSGSGAAAPWRQSQEKTAPKPTTGATSSPATSANRKQPQSSQESRRTESESSGSDHQTGSSSSTSSTSSSRSVNTGATFSTEEVKQRYQKAAAAAASGSTSTKSGSPSSKFRRPTPVSSVSVNSKKDETSETSSEESDTSSESEEEVPPKSPAATSTGILHQAHHRNNVGSRTLPRMVNTDIGPLLARSAVARERDPPVSTRSRAMSRDEGSSASASLSRQTSRDSDHHVPTTSSARSRHTTDDTTSTPRSRETAALERRMSRDDTSASSYVPYRSRQQKSPPERSYGSSTSSPGNRYGTSSSTSSPYDYGLSRSRTGTALYDPPESTSRLQSKYLNRSRHNLGTSFDSASDYHPTPSSTYDTSSSSSRPSGNPYYTGRTSYLTKHSINNNNDQHQRSSTSRERKLKLLSRSKSSHELVPSDNDPKSPTTPEDEQASLSSWARYLKSKYGKSVTGSSTDSLDLGTGRGKSSSPQKSSNVTTSQYCQKKRLIFKFGSRGSDSGYFTWPRGVACGPDNIIVVADSSNHRVQVFDQHGAFIKDFGQYGNGDGEFDCLAGIAVNRIGQFIISDRYNHRIQVFDPSGRWLRSFGSQGSTDGKFNYPWGVTTDALGFIYVCDKENHRVQVFQSDGTFVGKFGIGDLEHPHYIAVTCTNKVVVSDTGHHRVLIFDVNGKMINSIGTEGIENGQFKLPRGVAVDEQGYIFVGDSGNNRIQIFNPDGIHIRSFGGWGSGDGEFKGLEGIAVNSNGHALVCDRENHRIQVF